MWESCDMALPEYIAQSSVVTQVTNDPKPFTIRVRKGKTLEITATLLDSSEEPWDLTDWGIRLQVKEKLHYTAKVLEYTDVDSYIINYGTTGQVGIWLPGSITSAFTWGIGEYELEVYGGTPEDTYTVLRGRWVNIPEVTT